MSTHDDSRSAADSFAAGTSRALQLSAFMNLPNSLTVGRIFLVPLLVVVLLTEFEGRMVLGVRKEMAGQPSSAWASLTRGSTAPRTTRKGHHLVDHRPLAASS